MLRKIHVLRPGRHGGREWSAETLRQIADSYDAALHEAPIVVGHPRTDDPAYGWIGGLSCDGEGLHAAPREVDPAFAETVRAGRFRKVSVALYGPGSARNPLGEGGGWYLRHVGFLGATPPEVKGLRRAELGEDDAPDAVLEIELGEAGMNATHRLWRNLRDWLIGEKDLETADRVLPQYFVDETAPPERPADAPALAETRPRPQPAKEDPMPPDDNAAKAAAEREAALAEREKKLAEREAALARDADLREQAAFAEKLAADGRIAPADKDAVARALAAIPADAEIELAEGGTSKTRQALRQVLEASAPRVPYGEAAPANGAPANAATAALRLPEGWEAAEEGADLHRRALARAAKDGVGYEEAVERELAVAA